MTPNNSRELDYWRGKKLIIPQTIPECFTFLKVWVDKPSIESRRKKTRAELVDCQHDLGMFIRNNWPYSKESPLVKILTFLGMKKLDKDPLSALIIEAFWEHLNGEEYIQEEIIKRQ